ncbi:MAG: hypothetical protein IJG13_05995 [Kiritimatiellae bacterium]|nr:hypothetical protein [Kiritimatiellia bacterium]
MQGFYEIYQRVLMAVCMSALVAVFLGAFLYRARKDVSIVFGMVRRHPWSAIVLSPVFVSLYLFGATKPVNPTLRGITLGSPMETPSSVALSWQPDEGREINSNQLVRVYWRDAYTPWTLAAEGYGITNATVHGFFINRDTDWMVEIEDSGEDDE